MHVRFRDIDPELRIAGFFARIMIRPSERFFRFALQMGRRSEGNNVAGLDCEEHTISAFEFVPGSSANSDTKVRIRVYRPAGTDASHALPGLLFVHGGGYAIGNPEMSGETYKQFIATRPCVIVAPDYRKSLQAPYPAALNDCYATLLWMKDNAAELGIRTDQMMVAGQSAGGGLTAAISLMARDRGDVNIAFQLPLYPMIDDRMTTGSVRDNNAPVWGSRHNRLAWDLYLGELEKQDVPKYAAPAREQDFTRLPPTATFVGSLDPFRDETIEYVDELRAAGVPVSFRLFDRCYHGFDVIGAKTKVGKAANEFLCAQFAHAIDNCFSEQAEVRTQS